MTNSSTLSTGLLYHNATEMIKWLCETFGFEVQLIVPGQGGIFILQGVYKEINVFENYQ